MTLLSRHSDLVITSEGTCVFINNPPSQKSSSSSTATPTKTATTEQHNRHYHYHFQQKYSNITQTRKMASFAGTVLESAAANTATTPAEVATGNNAAGGGSASQQHQIIDGNAIAAQIRIELKQAVTEMKESLDANPGLAVVLVGDRKDSATYVRMKKKACAEVGVESFGFDYPSDVTQEELLAKIEELNGDPRVHGILVQLPLPPHINEAAIVHKIKQDKDVDGLHPLNIAELTNTKSNSPLHVSCTPQGCIELLLRSGVKIEGKEAVVLGRSNIVGMPVALLLMQRNATVTIAHSKTKDLPSVLKRADIVVAAIGRANFVQGDWLKPGCVVLDVGINSVEDATDKRGYRLVGDCHFESCSKIASQITPVPGGVGPMTIAMLLKNTITGARRAALESRATKDSL